MKLPVLGWVVSHPIQYLAPVFRRLANSEQIDFVAVFGSRFGLDGSVDPQFGRRVDFGIDLLSGYRSVFAPQVRRQPDINRFAGLALRNPPRLWAETGMDGVILNGWRTAMMWQTAIGSLWRRAPYFLRADTSRVRPPGRRTARQVARDLSVGAMVRNAAALLSMGLANDRFYESVGGRSGQLVRVPYTVDNAAVEAAVSEGRQQRNRLRAEFGVPEDAFLVIGVGKLLRRKRPLDLVEALVKLPEQVHVLWVGSGELEEELRASVVRYGLERRFHLAGFQPSARAWMLMAASDLFAFPSESEPWGLVVNEALIAGLPVLATTECGAAPDLVIPDRTGEVLRIGDIDGWVGAITKWHGRITSGHGPDRDKQAELISKYSVERACQAIESAFLEALERGRTWRAS